MKQLVNNDSQPWFPAVSALNLPAVFPAVDSLTQLFNIPTLCFILVKSYLFRSILTRIQISGVYVGVWS